ncbi:alpha/beta fold hydrolase [Martelella sp. HB161492]|uniref:alpha/beta hydrolase family protein n=1 Tax=Martelella sp. HB161492 TaxID=2720726 RepID=UPI001590170D|nr:alpha/beta fold hydrolase [Martelella sp. HB161492]
MRIFTPLLCSALALIGLATSAAAAEQTVSFDVDGQTVVGTLNVPDGAEAPPVVLLLHGFTGSRDELEIPAVSEGIYQRAARLWAEKGLASLRIDFMGSGDSDGSYADTTMQVEIADALAALDFLSDRTDIDPAKISVVGWSRGGAVAASIAGLSEVPLTSVSLWAPAVNMAATIYSLFGAEAVNKGLASGDEAIAYKLPWGAEVTLKGPFFRSLFEVDPLVDLTNYNGPLFVAVGTNDPIVFPQPETGEMILDAHDGPEQLWVQPMDHSFNSYEGVGMVDSLITTTGDFIAEASK